MKTKQRKDLEVAIYVVLQACSDANLNYQRVDEKRAEVITAYADAIEHARCTASEVLNAKATLLRREDFPNPAAIIDACETLAFEKPSLPLDVFLDPLTGKVTARVRSDTPTKELPAP